MGSLMKTCTFSTPTSWCLNLSVQESHISYRFENEVLNIYIFFFPQPHKQLHVFSADLPQRKTQHPLSRVWRALRDNATVLPSAAPLMRAFSIFFPSSSTSLNSNDEMRHSLVSPTHLLLSRTLSGRSVSAAARNRLVPQTLCNCAHVGTLLIERTHPSTEKNPVAH